MRAEHVKNNVSNLAVGLRTSQKHRGGSSLSVDKRSELQPITNVIGNVLSRHCFVPLQFHFDSQPGLSLSSPFLRPPAPGPRAFCVEKPSGGADVGVGEIYACERMVESKVIYCGGAGRMSLFVH